MVTFPLRVYDTLLEDTEMRKEGGSKQGDEPRSRQTPFPSRQTPLPLRLFPLSFLSFFPPAWLPLLPNHD